MEITMKKKLVLIFALLVSLLLVLGLSSCKKDEEENPDGTTAMTTKPSEAPVIPLNLMENGKVNVSVVYQAETNDALNSSLEAIENAFADKYGAEISTTVDSLHTPDEGKTEILLGKTKYDVSKNAADALKENSYSVSVKGNKIVIAANHEYLLLTGVEHFLECLSYEDGTLSIPKDFSYTSESFDTYLVGNADGETEYTIIYEAKNAKALAAATKLQEAFDALYIEIRVQPDTEPTEGKEILIGSTNRELSSESQAYYMNSWLELDESGNIAITGNLDNGADIIINYINALGADGSDIEFVEPMLGFFMPKGIAQAPLYDGSGEIEVIESFGPSKSYYITVHGAERDDYEDYTDLLADSGYTRYRSSEANGNIFETWTDGYSILTMAHISYIDPATNDPVQASESIGQVQYISIAVDCVDNSSLPPSEPEIEEITRVQITTVATTCGYVLRLSDGRFVVFDGGLSKYSETVYDIVTTQNEREGKPVIAAWFITHFHSDHVNAANYFMQDYWEEVDIQTFVHNLPGDELYIDKNTAEGVPNNEDTDLRDRGILFYENINTYYPEATIIVAHAGQQFVYGDIVIDVLWTSENLYKKAMIDTNQSSVLYSITGNSGRMIILGDQQERGCALLNAIYGDTLKCDLIQVSHHGHNGGDEDMYASMAASYAIWTAPSEDIISENRHYKPSYGRNLFDYTTVEYNIAPSKYGSNIILYDGMTKAELAELDIGLTH